ncbi:phosphatidate phosphatase PAH2-like isoform X2 [Vigna unguiculata]|uniref:phosphatidate phosphatase PAH2-like isoform X2 n=1 Tax=Vigna unguiculata TaxID=3917 RepID=UPI0010166510|nr:phosphatidate phosphatase PAH2-like isoform X2 [Vigna unguiculata]
MQTVGRILSQGVYTVSGPFHPFGGAVDIVVVEQKDGSFKSSPWYVRFGKFQGVLKSREKVVDICVNGVPAGFQMHLDHKGEAYFLREVVAQEEDNLILPPSPVNDKDDYSRRSKSCDYDGEGAVKTTSRRSRILGFVFGRRSLKQREGNGEAIGSRVGSLERAEIAANLLDLKWSTNLSGEQGQKVLANSSGDGNVVVEDDELKEEACFARECDLNGKEVVYDIAESDVQVACVKVKFVEKELNGEVSGVSAVDASGDNSNDISKNDVSADGVCRETPETSKLGVSCSSEQAQEVMYLAGAEECEEVRVHVHDEVLHRTTVLLSEGTEAVEVIEKTDLGMPVLGISEFHSGVKQIDCLDSGDIMYNEVDIEEQSVSTTSQTVKISVGHFSGEKVEPNCVIKPSSYSTPDDKAISENMKDKDSFSSLSTPLDPVDDCLPRKASRRSPSQSSEDERFLFSDLDESAINDRPERTPVPEHLDNEDHVSYENDTEKLTAISSPIVIPRNEAAGEKFGQHSGSLPNFSSGTDIMNQHDARYPLSQSLESRSKSLPCAFPPKDDLECPKPDEDKGNHLTHEESGAKDCHDSGEIKGDDPSTQNTSPAGNWRLWPFSLRRAGSKDSILPPSLSDAKNTTDGNSLEKTISTDMNKDKPKPKAGSKDSILPPSLSDVKNTTDGNSLENTISTVMDKDKPKPNFKKIKVRETTPTSEQVASLNLKDGMNTVTFTFSTAVLGNQQVDARIYLWKWNTRIVISDVDGTITRSDVLGQFMPLVGIDWSQTGVAHLYSAIKENGYQLLFLSARSISQAYLTRQFLVNLKQDGKVLPDGPVVISPDGLFPSLYREVIRRVPHEFKIACLEVIKDLFPSDCNPFYAGFGNRDTDEISYLKVGIPLGKIFIINPRGEVVVNRRVDSKSYASLHALVNGIFPPTNSSEQEDFNNWNFWKLPPPAIDI